MKALLMAAGAALLVSGCATMGRDDPYMGPPGAMALSPASRAYMEMAHSGNLFEVESSRLALQVTRNPVVRDFAQMMITDHGRMMDEMMGLSQQLGLGMPPMQMMPRHMDMYGRLRNTPPPQFDLAYHQAQMMAHQEALALHRNYAVNGDHPALRALAARAVPVVEMHLNHLRQHPHHAQPVMQQPPYTPPPPPPRRAGERG